MTVYAKTATYSLMHLSVAVTVAYLISRNWAIALGIGLVEPMVQTVAYHFHERLWQRRALQTVPVGVAIPAQATA